MAHADFCYEPYFLSYGKCMMNIRTYTDGMTKEKKKIQCFELQNQNHLRIEVSSLGAVIKSIYVLDKNGDEKDIVLGYSTCTEYYDNNCCFGAYIGRNANRISDAFVVINGEKYVLNANSGKNNIHSGFRRSHYEMYEAQIYQEQDSVSVEFYRNSNHLEQGFPGNLEQKIRYTLTDKNELHIDYCMVSDMDTVINPTNHSYFNLNGEGNGDILGHYLKISADYFLLTDEFLVPTGELQHVEGTPMDFREFKIIGKDIKEKYEPLEIAKGYDHNYVLDNRKYQEVANLYCEESGIGLRVLTDRCGLQLYSGNHLEGKKGKKGKKYCAYGGVCLETQFPPNACKIKKFPSSIQKKNTEFTSRTTYQLYVTEQN